MSVVDDRTGDIIRVPIKAERAFWDWAVVETLRHYRIAHRGAVRTDPPVASANTSGPTARSSPCWSSRRPRPTASGSSRCPPSCSTSSPPSSGGTPAAGARSRCAPLRHPRAGTSAPLPFLFQRARQPRAVPSSPADAAACCAGSAGARRRPPASPARFTPHDFRRLFATELVNSGLPIHIGAALLGHLNIQTTRGYVAVFDEDVVRHYQTHSHVAAQQRPAEEYRARHRRRMDRVRGALRQAQGRTRRLRPPLRHRLPARTRLHPLPDAARRPQDDRPARRNRTRPDRPPPATPKRGLARRDRRNRLDPQPSCAPSATRPDGFPGRARPHLGMPTLTR